GGFFVAAFRKSPDARPPRGGAEAATLPRSVDPQGWLAPLRARFGWSIFDDWVVFEPNKKTVCVASADIRPPAGVTNAGIGLGLLHRAMAEPRATTAAAMFFGPQTTSGV